MISLFLVCFWPGRIIYSGSPRWVAVVPPHVHPKARIRTTTTEMSCHKPEESWISKPENLKNWHQWVLMLGWKLDRATFNRSLCLPGKKHFKNSIFVLYSAKSAQLSSFSWLISFLSNLFSFFSFISEAIHLWIIQFIYRDVCCRKIWFTQGCCVSPFVTFLTA